MPLNRSHRLAAIAACAVSLSSGWAFAQQAAASSAECASAYEESQVSRKAGRLTNARVTLQLCAREECPDFIRSDCATWYDEVLGEVPTIVFAARSQGRDLVDVQVSLDGRELVSRIDGQALELDPGEYDFSFSAPGMQPLTQRSVIVRGERNRLIQVELTPVDAGPTTPLPPAPPAKIAGRSLLLPGVLAGVGVAGLAGFAALAASGRASESRLEDSCAPNCTAAQIGDVRTKYLVADVSLGVGVASLALGAYFFFSQSSAPAARGPALSVQASARGAGVAYGGAF